MRKETNKNKIKNSNMRLHGQPSLMPGGKFKPNTLSSWQWANF